jgi:hypothetical protein
VQNTNEPNIEIGQIFGELFSGEEVLLSIIWSLLILGGLVTWIFGPPSGSSMFEGGMALAAGLAMLAWRFNVTRESLRKALRDVLEANHRSRG